MAMTARDDSSDVLIAGGGVAALEALMALRAHAGEAAAIRVLAPQRDFVLRATSVLEPFARGTARRIPVKDIVEHHGATLVTGALASVDADAGTVLTTEGEPLHYGTLLVALGTVPEAAFPGVVTFAGPSEHGSFADVLAATQAGDVEHLVFAVPPGATWPLPAYELALLTVAHLREHGGPAIEIAVVTPEERPLELFGRAASAALEERLTGAGIALHTLCRPRAAEGGRLLLEGGASLPADRVVALPRLRGPAIEGLPADDMGFIPVDDHGRVRGAPGVYAAGDCTAFPLKQGGIAAQQADAAAAAIAADMGVLEDPEPFEPVLRGLLLTAQGPTYFRAHPGADREPSTVAIDARPRRRTGGDGGVAAERPLWWPPSKVAGRYLGAYLARPERIGSPQDGPRAIEDRPAPDTPEAAAAEEERVAALDLALMLADGEARYGDWHAALRALDAAEAIAGVLPEEYVQKRELWRAELGGGPTTAYLGG
jgi:sulfide:quinone oxidoreductase